MPSQPRSQWTLYMHNGYVFNLKPQTRYLLVVGTVQRDDIAENATKFSIRTMTEDVTMELLN